MNLINKLTVMFGVALATVPFAHAAENGYVRISAAEFIPTADDSDNATGAMVAFGTTLSILRSNNVNQFELETGWAQWNYSEAGVIGGTAYTAKADLTFIPVLFTYRYQWNFSERFNLAVGPSVGMICVDGSGSAAAGGTSIGVSDSDWIFSYGAGVQLNYKVSDSVTLTAGYRYLINQDATFSVSGTKVKLDDLNAQVIEIGLRFDWPY